MARTAIRDIEHKYEDEEPLTMLTAYDSAIAAPVDTGGVDMILVGDTAGRTHHGYEDEIPLTLDEALSNTAAVVRGSEDALIIGDLPFLSYGASMEQSVQNAGRFLKEAGAGAVKLETAPDGETTIELVDRLTELGIPVMGHLGLTPQRMNELGGPVIQGREGVHSDYADTLVDTARRLEAAGIFALVLEAVTEGVGKRITEEVSVPTIGIGAGRYTDGQVLVTTDLLGLNPAGFKLSKQYADLDGVIHSAVQDYVDDVENGEFPAQENAYEPVDE
jgi:3-methyl-2-oxobutanoate hydroxymethyltransferase